MKIGGLQRLTLIDYPKKTACTLFIAHCNFRCPWCYAPELVVPEKIKEHEEITEEYFFEFLKKRKNKLDGVVICGGEPTLSPQLPSLVERIKKEGFLVKIDTNGSNPEIIESLAQNNLLDYVAVDIKHRLNEKDYQRATGVKVDVSKIKQTAEFLINGTLPYEFRTTLVPQMHQKEDVESIASEIKGAEKYFLQNFYPQKTIDPSLLSLKPFSKEQMEEFKNIARKFVKSCQTR